MRAIKYFLRLLKELCAFAWQRKVWWIVPLTVLLLLIAFILVAGQVATPFIYTIF